MRIRQLEAGAAWGALEKRKILQHLLGKAFGLLTKCFFSATAQSAYKLGAFDGHGRCP
jgi:hypothetical protein